VVSGAKDMFVTVPPMLYLTTLLPRLAGRLLFFALLGGFLGGRDLLLYALIGNSVASAATYPMAVTTQSLTEELRGGTLAILSATPTNPLWAVTAWGMGRVVLGFVESMIGLIAASLLMSFHLPFQAIWVIPVTLVNTLSVYGLGLMLAAICYRFQGAMLISNSAQLLLSFLAGVNFPVETLPVSLQAVSWFLPLSHGLLAVRTLFAGAPVEMVPVLVAKELGVGLLYLLAGVSLFQWQMVAARRRGTYQ
jgi:ABC-2 type transport system permease protein